MLAQLAGSAWGKCTTQSRTILLSIRIPEVYDAVLLSSKRGHARTVGVHCESLRVVSAYDAEHDSRAVRRGNRQESGSRVTGELSLACPIRVHHVNVGDARTIAVKQNLVLTKEDWPKCEGSIVGQARLSRSVDSHDPDFPVAEGRI